MEDEPETLMDRQFRDIMSTPLWLSLMRLTLPVSWVGGGLILMFQGAPDDDFLLLLFIIAPLIVLQLIFERTIGRRIVKKFRAEKIASRRPDELAATTAASVSPIDQSQVRFSKIVMMSLTIGVVGLISHFLAASSGNSEWFFLVMVVLFGFAATDIVMRWRRAKTWAKTYSDPEVKDVTFASLRGRKGGPRRILIGLVPMVLFLVGMATLGVLVLKTESALWTFLFWPMLGGIGIIGAYLHQWAHKNRES